MSPLSGVIEASTRQAIEDLIVEHAWLIDHSRANEVAELYTNDGRLLGVGPDKVGRAAITHWAEQRATMTDRRSRHVQTNVRLEFIAHDAVRGTTVLTLYRHDGSGAGSPTPLLIGEYEDVYVKGTDERWRFRSRSLRVLFGES